MDPYVAYLTRARGAAAALGVAAGALPDTTRPADGLYVKHAGNRLVLAYTERGGDSVVVEGDAETIAFAVVTSLVGAAAQAHELRHRRVGEDSRRQWMLDHVRRLAAAEPGWADRQRAAYDAVLAVHPFDDQLARRAERWSALMAAGLPRAEAVAQAERELPPVPPRPEDHRLPRAG